MNRSVPKVKKAQKVQAATPKAVQKINKRKIATKKTKKTTKKLTQKSSVTSSISLTTPSTLSQTRTLTSTPQFSFTTPQFTMQSEQTQQTQQTRNFTTAFSFPTTTTTTTAALTTTPSIQLFSKSQLATPFFITKPLTTVTQPHLQLNLTQKRGIFTTFQNQNFQKKISSSSSPISTSHRKFSAADTIEDNSVIVPPELEKKYKRLMFQATQRGWLELDLIFTAYVATYKSKLMNEESLNYLTEVCDCDNSDLVRWFVEGTPLPEEWKKNPVMVDMLDYALMPSKPWYPKAGNQ